MDTDFSGTGRWKVMKFAGEVQFLVLFMNVFLVFNLGYSVRLAERSKVIDLQGLLANLDAIFSGTFGWNAMKLGRSFI